MTSLSDFVGCTPDASITLLSTASAEDSLVARPTAGSSPLRAQCAQRVWPEQLAVCPGRSTRHWRQFRSTAAHRKGAPRRLARPDCSLEVRPERSSRDEVGGTGPIRVPRPNRAETEAARWEVETSRQMRVAGSAVRDRGVDGGWPVGDASENRIAGKRESVGEGFVQPRVRVRFEEAERLAIE